MSASQPSVKLKKHICRLVGRWLTGLKDLQYTRAFSGVQVQVFIAVPAKLSSVKDPLLVDDFYGGRLAKKKTPYLESHGIKAVF